MARILLAGFGKLAQKLAPQLQNAGHQVVGLKRHPAESSIPIVQADLSDKSTLKQLDASFDYVIITLTPGAMTDNAYRNTYVQGTRNLIEHFQQYEQAPCFIYVSSTRVYGQSKGEWINEESETAPNSEKGRLLLQAEEHIRQTNDHIIVRFSGIYGASRQHFIKQVDSGIEIQHTPPKYSNRIHEDDCVAVLSYLIEKHQSGVQLDDLYLASDSSPTPVFEVALWLADKMNAPAPIPQKNPSADQGKRCDNQRLRQLGFCFQYPSYQSGYSQMPSCKTV